MTILSKVRAKKIAANWGEASSLGDAMSKAGIKTLDPRSWNRYRRETEKILDVCLAAHNPQFSSYHNIECPSDLSVSKAKKYKTFVITSCTNNSELDSRFLGALERLCNKKTAQLLIVPVRYNNPSAMITTENYLWDERIYPYALTEDIKLSNNLIVSALRLQATAVNPLSTLQDNAGESSAIYGHPQLAMELVATPKDEIPKLMHTTGSVSHPYYSSSKAGGRAQFHHTMSALFVKIVGDKFYLMQLMWDGNGFYFLDEYYSNKYDSNDNPIAGLVMGDNHTMHSDSVLLKAREKLKEKTSPEYLIWNDIHDHYSQSHHHTLLDKVKIAFKNQHLVVDEIMLSIDAVAKYGDGYKNLIVESNHDGHLDRWVNTFNPNKDPHNAIFQSWLFNLLATTDNMKALEICFNELKPKDFPCVEFLSANTSFLICGIDVSQHGDRGANGSRGSAKGIAKTQRKTFIAHSHSPRIEKGCWQVGTSTMNLPYQLGLSTWMQCDGLIYKNGKRALVMYIKGKSIVDYLQG